jgi:hypothetical protein
MDLFECFQDLTQVTTIQVIKINNSFEFALPLFPDKNNKMTRFNGTFEECVNGAISFLFDKEKPEFEKLKERFESKSAAIQILQKWGAKQED